MLTCLCLAHLAFLPAGAPPTWLKSPSLPRTFVLELLDFVLTNSPAVFRQLPPFQALLSQRMTQLIQAQVQDHLDAGAAASSFATNNFTTFRALLRLTRTLLRSFYPLLGPRSGTLVQSLMAGGLEGGLGFWAVLACMVLCEGKRRFGQLDVWTEY